MILALTFSEASVIGLLVAAVQFGTLLYLAALGETVAAPCSRSCTRSRPSASVPTRS